MLSILLTVLSVMTVCLFTACCRWSYGIVLWEIVTLGKLLITLMYE